MALISVSELQNLIQQQINTQITLPEKEQIAIAQAAGRVLAQDIISPMNVPNANVSAMDGYALPCAAQLGEKFKLVGESAAGHPFSGSVETGECVRIMTGAVVPRDCTTVVLQENTQVDEDGHICLTQDVHEKQNIRYAGEEITAGAKVLRVGRILNHADILVLAALGFGTIQVYQKIKVAVLSTGDELVEPSEPLAGSSQIYDSNRHMMMSRLRDLPIEIIDLKKVEDDLEAVMHTLDDAAQKFDVVMTSGGVSVGDYDYLRQAVERLGVIHHYKVAIKPGKPFVFGHMFKAWYFGLPGNPISGFVGFDMFVQAALWRLCGATDIPQPLRFKATLTVPVKKAVGRMDIQRATITCQENGEWTVAPCGSQDSHRILGISLANAYMILPQDSGDLNVGDIVEVQPFPKRFL